MKNDSLTPIHIVTTLRTGTCPDGYVIQDRIIRAALSGELPDGFSLQKVRKVETDDWEEQERQLGFPVEDDSPEGGRVSVPCDRERIPA